MSPRFYFSLAAVPVLLIFLMTAFAQDKNAEAAKEKADKDRAVRFRRLGQMMAEQEQRKAIINDLIDTQAECEKRGNLYIEAKDGSDQKKFYELAEERCYAKLEAKIERTPLDVLTPFSFVTKGTDLSFTKRIAFYRLYAAYEYGLIRAKQDKP